MRPNAPDDHRRTRARENDGGRRSRANRAAILTRGLALALVVTLLPVASARASDPLLTILKGTLLGSLTGLVLGGTLTLVVDDESRSDTVRWGVVIGTFAGFGTGVWQAVASRDDLFAGPADPPERVSPAAGCQLRLALLRLSW